MINFESITIVTFYLDVFVVRQRLTEAIDARSSDGYAIAIIYHQNLQHARKAACVKLNWNVKHENCRG